MPTLTETPVDLGGDLVTHAARLVRSMRRRHSLSAAPRVLSVLDELGPSTITALAAAYQSSQPTMSALVNQLDERGWVTRGPHPTDTRASLIALTETGATELRRVRRVNGEDLAARLADHPTLTTEELRIAVTVLHELLPTDEDPI